MALHQPQSRCLIWLESPSFVCTVEKRLRRSPDSLVRSVVEALEAGPADDIPADVVRDPQSMAHHKRSAEVNSQQLSCSHWDDILILWLADEFGEDPEVGQTALGIRNAHHPIHPGRCQISAKVKVGLDETDLSHINGAIWDECLALARDVMEAESLTFA